MVIYKRTIAYLTLVSICASLLGACASADRPSLLQTPTTARPKPIQETSANMGSLYPANSGGPQVSMVSHRPLFEDRRARNVGDTLTARSTVVSARESKGKTALGIVSWHSEGFNQHGDKVLDYTRTNLVRQRSRSA